MHIIIERSSLLRSLHHLHRIVERRHTIPVLSNVLLQAEKGHLRMKTTDLDMEMTEAAEAQISQPGQTSVPAHLLHDIVSKLPDGAHITLALNESGHTIAVNCGSADFQLQALPGTDFPELVTGSFPHVFEVSALFLKNLIDKIRFAVSTEETRHYLGGIYLHIQSNDKSLPRLRAVATDGHRLAKTEIEAPQGSSEIPGVIIPRKTINEIQRLLENPELRVRIEISETKVRFTLGDTLLTSRLIDGSFPDYQRVIPSANDKKLIVDRQRFVEVVDRVSTIAPEKGRPIRLSLSTGNITLSINNPNSGSARETLLADYDSENLETGFNAKYLLDIAGQLSGEKACLMFADAGSPVLIEDIEDKTTLYVLMPMRI